MNVNANLTIFNFRGVSKATARSTYFRTVIRGVNFYTDQKTRVTDSGGLVSADMYKVRIPEDANTEGKQYIDAVTYKKLSDEEAKNYWTIDNGDLFGRGILEEFDKEASFLKQQYTGKVMSFSDNRRGCTPHWRIGGA